MSLCVLYRNNFKLFFTVATTNTGGLTVPFQLQSPNKYVNKGDQVLFQPQTKVVFLCFFQPQKWVGKSFHIQEHRQSSCAFETTCAPLSCAFSKAVKRFFNHKERRSSAFSTTNNGDQALFQPKINMLIYFYNHKQCDLVFFSVTSKRWSSVS